MRILAIAVSTALLFAGAVVYVLFSPLPRSHFLLTAAKFLFSKLDISVGLLNPYHLRRRLFEIFREENAKPEDPGPRIEYGEMHIVLVCASLQSARQVMAEPEDDLVEALLAAMAIPGIFPPLHDPKTRSDLIDGVAIRQNPMPALFQFFRDNPNVAKRMERADRTPTIHVVYNVPIEPYDPKPDEADEKPDIIEAALASLELAQRRDTRQEVYQRNLSSELQRCLHAAERRQDQNGEAAAAPQIKPGFSIFADEIAPPRDIAFANNWSPGRKELLAAVALGCQSTLETLYAPEIKDACGGGVMNCRDLLARIAPGRMRFLSADAPGMPEVCRECSKGTPIPGSGEAQSSTRGRHTQLRAERRRQKGRFQRVRAPE